MSIRKPARRTPLLAAAAGLSLLLAPPLGRAADPAVSAPVSAPEPLPSAVPSPFRSPVPEAETGPKVFHAKVTALELTSKRASARGLIQLLSPLLPADLPELETGAKTVPGWDYPVTVSAANKDLILLHDKDVVKFVNGQASIPIRLVAGENTGHITVIDPRGKTVDFDLHAKVEMIEDKLAGPGDPKGFGVVGPIIYSQSISHSGTAIGAPTSSHALMLGVRGIWRRRLLKPVTDRLPWSVKIFFDGTAVLGKTVSGDAAAGGMPKWLDGRFTLELFATGQMRFETGFGLSYFSPGLDTYSPGDLEQFLSLVGSVRFSYPLSPKLMAFLGANVALPSTSSDNISSLGSQPMEFFAAISTPRGRTGYLELRLRHYRVSTTGTIVGAGSYRRLETFTGPEWLWVWKF